MTPRKTKKNAPPLNRETVGNIVEKCSGRAAADGDRHTPVFELVN
jgi:hypothetical protein